jgi:hypothetical protein
MVQGNQKMKNKFGHKYSICLLPVIGLLILIASGCQPGGTEDMVTTLTPPIEVTPVVGQAVVIVDVAPLRSYPDTQAETVGNLSEGALVDLLGVSPSEEWYLVKEVESPAGQSEAWILAAFIEQIETATPTPMFTITLLRPATPTYTITVLPIAPTNTATLIPPSPPALRTTASPLPAVSEPVATFIQNGHCRRGPGTVYDIVTSLEQGVSVIISGRNADSSWWWIQLPNSQAKCWVSTVVVAVSGSPDELPLGPIPPTPTLVQVNTPTPTDTLLPPDTPTPTNTAEPGTQPAPPT